MCTLERMGKICVLRLTGDGEHRFNPSLFSQLHLALAEVSSHPEVRALVTTNDGRYFSNGLDLAWAQAGDHPPLRNSLLLSELERLILAFMKLDIPTYAALCGHAAAGGLLFAMAHDHRIMRADRGFLYSAAVDINFVIPPASVALLRSKASPKAFKDLVLQGVKYTGSMALEAGLIDSLQENPELTLKEAIKQASEFAERPWERLAYRGLRLAMYEEVIDKLESDISEECIAGGFVGPTA